MRFSWGNLFFIENIIYICYNFSEVILCPKSKSDNNLIDRIVGKDTLAKGIKVSKDKEKITLDVFIVADYGVKIPQLAWDIQTAVKEHVLKITNKKISAVNIHVQGVALPKRFRRNDE